MLLSASTFMFCADVAAQTNAKTTTGGKQTYSNRPIGYSVPSPYYGTPMAPRFLAPPVVPAHSRAVRVYTSESEGAAPVMAPIVTESHSLPQQVVKETVVVLRDPPPEISVNDELDAFYARLAKIQLEKHQLPEALALVQQIKSEAFKVRTVVNLAEFVSRDKNYRSEAEQLYRLSLIGMEALGKKQPFRIDIGNVKVVTPPVVPQQVPQQAVVPVEPAKPLVPMVEQPANQGRRPTVVQLMEDDPSETGPAQFSDGTILRNGNGNGNGKLPPPPPPSGDTNDVISSPVSSVVNQEGGSDPTPLPTPPAATTPEKVSPADSAETRVPAVDPIVKPAFGISLEEDEPEPTVAPKAPERPQTPATPTRARPRAVIIPDDN